MAVAGAFAWSGAGAWGVSITALCGLGMAIFLLLVAAARSAKGKGKASIPRAVILRDPGEPANLTRRTITFLLAVPGALATALAIGVASRGLVTALHWREANANALGLFVMPLAWAILLHVVLMQEHRKAQGLTLLAGGIPALAVIAAGGWL